MNIITLNHSAGYGGASRASFRIHEAINQCSDEHKSEYFSATIKNNNLNVDYYPTKFEKYTGMVKSSIISTAVKKITSSDEMMSINLINSKWPSRINSISPDLINLNWICAEMMSISDIRKFKMPIVWTMHDMWPFSGASHIPLFSDKDVTLHDLGFRKKNLDRWVEYRKKKLIGKNITFVSPSKWLASLASKSWLGDSFNIKVIPNPIDTEFWQPTDKKFIRKLLGVPVHSKIVLFGAMNLESDINKGYDLLLEGLNSLSRKDVYLITFGGSAGQQTIAGMQAKGFGYIQDDLLMRLLYVSADVTVIPSRSENLPNVALESLSCGTPLVSFGIGGLTDIIQHKVNGYLASPFDSRDLAKGIEFLLNKDDKALSAVARDSVLSRYSYEKISKLYLELYSEILSN
jgi:glycosyltransferase involved in cell wall biosynthesis